MAHYPNGAGGWADKVPDIEEKTELFLIEVRKAIPPALAEAICNVSYVPEDQINFARNASQRKYMRRKRREAGMTEYKSREIN